MTEGSPIDLDLALDGTESVLGDLHLAAALFFDSRANYASRE